MRFSILAPRRRPPLGSPGWYLVRNTWDDYTFKTTFNLWHVGTDAAAQIGIVKIGKFGMESPNQIALPETFEELDDNYFSLGQDDTYYERLRHLGDSTRVEILSALRDMAFDLELFSRARQEEVTEISLLRSVNQNTVIRQYHRIATGGVRLYPFNFRYIGPALANNDGPGLDLEFAVEPESLPPTNIHTIIGSNGVGKTRLLSRLARAVADGSATSEEVGLVVDLVDNSRSPFANMVSVSFSTFDRIDPVRESNGTEHAYVTLSRLPLTARTNGATPYRDPAEDFKQAVIGLTGPRLERWLNAVRTLEADPIFQDAHIPQLAHQYLEQGNDDAYSVFESLSSGHKIVLLAITRLAEFITERTLLLIDEPETHLHPPLLAAFIRAVSDLLVERNGVAIVATHSPVVLQETPKSCVWKLRRSGTLVQAERPIIETFGENVGVLTHEAFGLEVTNSGFHKEISRLVDQGHSYEQILSVFAQQLGGEARALARALISVRNHGGYS